MQPIDNESLANLEKVGCSEESDGRPSSSSSLSFDISLSTSSIASIDFEISCLSSEHSKEEAMDECLSSSESNSDDEGPEHLSCSSEFSLQSEV